MCKECRQDGVDIPLARVYDSPTTTCAKTLITYIRLAMPAPNVLVANVFGNGITDILCHKIGTSLLSSASLFLHLSPLPRPTSSKIWEMDSTYVPHVRVCCVLYLYNMWLYAQKHQVSEFQIQKDQVPVPCNDASCLVVFCMVQGLNPFEWKTSVLDVSMHITKYNLNTVHSTLLHEMHQYTAQGCHHFGLKTAIPHVSMHTTYNINNGT